MIGEVLGLLAAGFVLSNSSKQKKAEEEMRKKAAGKKAAYDFGKRMAARWDPRSYK